MNRPQDGTLQFFFGTLAQPCPYLSGRWENKVVTELPATGAEAVHDDLVRAGYRRSHTMVYKPACRDCAACVPVRIAVEHFHPSRGQRRVLRRNADLRAIERLPRASAEQYDLFSRYQRSRHADGGMAGMTFGDYRAMVEETRVETVVVEFRDAENRLVAVSLTDRMSDALSGVYKFYDPEQAARSAGTHVVLWHIGRARELGLAHVYLGYWIAACRKMSYKTKFRPIEALGPDGWRLLDGGKGADGVETPVTPPKNPPKNPKEAMGDENETP